MGSSCSFCSKNPSDPCPIYPILPHKYKTSKRTLNLEKETFVFSFKPNFSPPSPIDGSHLPSQSPPPSHSLTPPPTFLVRQLPPCNDHFTPSPSLPPILLPFFLSLSEPITILEGEKMYEGEVKNGLKEGKGILRFRDNDEKFYFGEFKDGKIEGKGKLFFSKEEYYEGNFKQGKFEGRGVYLNSTCKYEGEWKAGKMEGKGKEIYPNEKKEYQNSITFDENKKNKMEEKVLDTKKNSWHIEIDGKMCIRSYNSSSKNGKKGGNTKGKQQKRDAKTVDWLNFDQDFNFAVNQISYFEGEYRGGKKNGNGKIIFGNGSYFEGEFFDDNIQGYGKFVSLNQNFTTKKYQYNLSDGDSKQKQCIQLHKASKNSKELSKKGKNVIYEGQWFNNMLNGFGKTLFGEDQLYIGNYKDNKKEGLGLFKWNQEKLWVGFWKKGRRKGKGILIKNGKEKMGVWQEGEMIEKLLIEEEEEEEFLNIRSYLEKARKETL